MLFIFHIKVTHSSTVSEFLAIDIPMLIRIERLAHREERISPVRSMIHDEPNAAYSRTIRFDCADNAGALISVHNCLPALNGAGSIFNWMPAKCQLHRRGSQIEPVPLNNGSWDTIPWGGGGKGNTPLSYTLFYAVPHSPPLRVFLPRLSNYNLKMMHRSLSRVVCVPFIGSH